MRRRSPRSTLTDTLFPVTTLCRSCLHQLLQALQAAAVRGGLGLLAGRVGILRRCRRRAAAAVRGALGSLGLARSFALGFRAHDLAGAARAAALRQEANKSELPSQMRIWYAGFRFQKKKQ